MSFSDQNLSVVRRCRCRKLFTFSSSSPEPLGQFQPNLAQSMNQVCSNEGPRPFPRGDNYELAKIHSKNLKSSPESPGLFQPNLAQSILG